MDTPAGASHALQPINNHWINGYNGVSPNLYGSLSLARSGFNQGAKPPNMFQGAGRGDTGNADGALKGSGAVSDKAAGGKSEEAKKADAKIGEVFASAAKNPNDPELDLLSKYAPATQQPIVYSPGIVNPAAFGSVVMSSGAPNEVTSVSPGGYNTAAVFSNARMGDQTVFHAIPVTLVPSWGPNAFYDRQMGPQAFAAVHPGAFTAAYNVPTFASPGSDQSCKSTS